MWRVMPWDLSAFVGRVGERAALCRALGADDGAPQLHSLHGMAGAGKTRLARVVAAELGAAFPGGRVFCDLDQGLETLAAALGAPAGDDTGERIASALTLRERTLCVLDHAGAVHPGLPAALPAWLSAGAHAFVVTSRAPLELRGARRLEVGPLEEVAALELLARRTEELGRPPVDAAAARRLVDAIGGLPLAIELCAGAVGEDVPERQRSLERVAADIWRSLEVDARHGLAVASVFAGDFSPADFAALGGEGLDRLVTHGLVARSGGVHRVNRWLRDFARARTPHGHLLERAHVERLLATGGAQPLELLAAGESIAGWYPDLSSRALVAAAEGLSRAGHSSLRRRALDRAIDVCDQPAARLARAELARHAGRAAEARADLATLPEPWPEALAARASRLAALLALDGGDPAEAARLLDQAVAAATDDRERARSLAVRFAHRLVLAEPPGDGDSDGIAAYDRFRTSGDATGAASVLANLGLAALHRGEDARARERLGRAEEEARASGDRPGLAGARLFLGLGDLAAGPLDRAIAALAEAEEMALDLARSGIWSDAVGYGAIARLLAGQPAARAALASHSDELARRGPPHARAFFAAVLHLVDEVRPPPDPELARGRPLLAAAIAALAAPPAAPYGLPVRIALRVRGALLPGPPPAPATPWLAVSADRRRFALGGAEVDLTRRGPLARVFAALVARAGADASADQLIAAGWPGESIQPEAARLRLYNAIAALRAMGLRGLLVTTDSGYRLEARFQDLSAPPSPPAR
jgi:tetratricopeptide (TPR) repeat protein